MLINSVIIFIDNNLNSRLYLYCKDQELIMNDNIEKEETCCKYTCCADGCCSDGCKTGECSSSCCKDGCCDSDNCC